MLAHGHVDVMLTHEAVDLGTWLVDNATPRPNRRLFDERGLIASRRNRALVTGAWTDLKPARLLHGHRHLRAEGHFPDPELSTTWLRTTREGTSAFLTSGISPGFGSTSSAFA